MEYYEQIYSKEVDNWDEMDKFPERNELTKTDSRIRKSK